MCRLSVLNRTRRTAKCKVCHGRAAVWMGVVLIAITAVGASRAAAQHVFEEDFEGVGVVEPGQEGPAGLIAAGWIFRNQSDPRGATPAWNPNGGVGWPYSGRDYLRATSSSAGQFGAKLSVWAILPDIPELDAGQIFSLWVLDGAKPSVDTFIEIRRSPGGGTDTGNGPLDVGDFTDVLFERELPMAEGPFIYHQIREVLPGRGRLAIRFRAPVISNFPTTATLYIDALTIGDDPEPPCGLVLPEPGETITWKASDGPFSICNDLIIPAGATLILERGAVVEFTTERRLYVEGTLIAEGTRDRAVTLTGDNVSGLFVKGAVTMDYTAIDCSVQLDPGGEATLRDSVLGVEAWLSATDATTALFMERCDVASLVFSGAGASHYRDVHFTNPETHVQLGRISKSESVTSAAPLNTIVNCQTRLIEGVTISGVAGPAIIVGSSQTGTADVMLDESNLLTGNEYPIFLRNGGLHAASVVPRTGNTHNAILAPLTLGSASDLRSQAALPDLRLPYHVGEDATFNGRVDIPPGTLFLLAPDASINLRQNNGWHPQLRGLPDKPIRFERLDPDRPWAVLASTQGVNLWEHLAIDGAGWGAHASQSDIYLRDCDITNCGWGAKPSGDGFIYGSGNYFSGNDVAVENDTSRGGLRKNAGTLMDGAERPNIFEGNTLAARNVPGQNGQYAEEMHLENNWWGHETGPYEPLFHPEGEGDEISIFVLHDPWREELPDMKNERPVVRLLTKPHPVALTGDKIFLEWEASNDGAITGFDIEVRTPPTFEDPPGWRTLVSDLPPWTRRYELTVPAREHGDAKQVKFRILAHEANGQTGLEFFWLNIPDRRPIGTVEFLSDLRKGFLYDGWFDLCYTAMDIGATPTLYIELDGDMRTMYEAGLSPGERKCISRVTRLPMVSTDCARFAIRAQGNSNDDYWHFSDYFSIRPDERFQDAPPDVRITSPRKNKRFDGGSVIPIEWEASDDDFVREVRIQVSLNGGYTYHTIADGLPGETTSYGWRLPTSDGVPDVRIRVVAIDKRFQNSSDVVETTITRGREPRPGDLNGDRSIDLADWAEFAACIAGPGVPIEPPCDLADMDLDRDVDLSDAALFQSAFGER